MFPRLFSAISIDAASMFKSYLSVSLKVFNSYTSIGTEYKIDGSKGKNIIILEILMNALVMKIKLLLKLYALGKIFLRKR